ncbi:hypothetical protein [Bacillus cihuensis]|nr:hypothetical protein [Bacillus cihuensis]
MESRVDNDSAIFVTERSPHQLSTAMTHLLNNRAPIEGIQSLNGAIRF